MIYLLISTFKMYFKNAFTYSFDININIIIIFLYLFEQFIYLDIVIFVLFIVFTYLF